MRRPPALYSHPEQLCWMSSLQGGRMVFDPGFPGFDHGIENGEQFAHGCDEGDLFGFADCAQAPVESADHRVVAVAVKVAMYRAGRTWARPPPPTTWVPGALASELATVAVERGHADEGGDLAAVQWARVPLVHVSETDPEPGAPWARHARYSQGLLPSPTIQGYPPSVGKASAASAGPPAGGAGPVGGGHATGLERLSGCGHPGLGAGPQGSSQPAHAAPPAAGAAV